MKKISLYLLLLSVISCVKELPKEDTRKFNSENEWIFDVMTSNYLYRDDLPKAPNYGQTPDNFFYSLLSAKDGSVNARPFSRIEPKKINSKSLDQESTYGFEFVTYTYREGSTYPPFMRVLYVINNSPAAKAGLQRGDYILKINDKQITNPEAGSLRLGGSKKLSVVKNRAAREPLTFNTPDIVDITLPASVPMEDNPLFLRKVINQNNTKIGYLVYNHFTSGLGEDSSIDKRYDDTLCTLSNEFAREQISELVLDLRYNGGGLVTAAQLLGTLIAPSYALENTFCKLKDVKNNIIEYKLSRDMIKNGTNLNLGRLFVLTSKYTASASELIINALRPYMEVIVIGDVTVGKNVASVSFKHEKYDHVLRPITHYVYNKDGNADYATGFRPDYSFNDIQQNSNTKLYNLGDSNESLLKLALDVIAGKAGRSTTTKTTEPTYKIIYTTKTEDLIITN